MRVWSSRISGCNSPKELLLSSLCTLQGLRKKNAERERASERAGRKRGPSGEEEKEDAISEVVRSVYRVVGFRPARSPLLPFILTAACVEDHCRGTHKRRTAFTLLPDPFICPVPRLLSSLSNLQLFLAPLHTNGYVAAYSTRTQTQTCPKPSAVLSG